jgi:DNA modification methylase
MAKGMSTCPPRQGNILQVLQGDCRHTLKSLPDSSIQCCVTSPPYWGLRSYLPKDHPDKPLEIGQEKTPAEYVETMVKVFREVWRVLKDDGVVFLNLGDSYFGSGCGGNPPNSKHQKQRTNRGSVSFSDVRRTTSYGNGGKDHCKLKPKDLVGIPWRVALALQADGWYLRSDIIWAKPNCMPESITDRPTRSHEYIFLLSKSERYYYDHEVIKEPAIYDVDGTGTAARKARARDDLKSHPNGKRAGIRPGGYKNSVNFGGKNNGNEKQRGHSRRHNGFNDRLDSMEKAEQCTGMRNKRDVWIVSPAKYRDAHFAVFPPALIKPYILAGSATGDVVLDPFGGSGTTGQVAIEFGRKAILCELNAAYITMIKSRTTTTPGLPL